MPLYNPSNSNASSITTEQIESIVSQKISELPVGSITQEEIETIVETKISNLPTSSGGPISSYTSSSATGILKLENLNLISGRVYRVEISIPSFTGGPGHSNKFYINSDKQATSYSSGQRVQNIMSTDGTVNSVGTSYAEGMPTITQGDGVATLIGTLVADENEGTTKVSLRWTQPIVSGYPTEVIVNTTYIMGVPSTIHLENGWGPASNAYGSGSKISLYQV